MMKLINLRSQNAWAGLALFLASAVASSAAVLHVPADYRTIQGAVDAAKSGDEIRIAAGRYAEQVLVASKNLKLIGDPGAVIEALPGLATTLTVYGDPDVQPLLGFALCDEVTVRGLTLDGKRLGPVNPGLVGVAFHGSSGRMEHCLVRGFRLATGIGGVGFGTVNSPFLGRPPQQVQVLGNHFEDNQNAIVIAADGAVQNDVRLRFRIQRNTIVGSGPTDTETQIGINVRAGTTGEIRNNTISDHDFTGGFGFSQGILAEGSLEDSIPLPPIRYEDNTFRNNQNHVVSLLADHSEFVNNTFQATGLGYRAGGLYVSGDHVRIVNNEFSDMPTGIMLFGDDPDFGTTLGIARNATLIANQFCHVAMPILIEPLVTGTQEHGTQLNACQTPPHDGHGNGHGDQHPD